MMWLEWFHRMMTERRAYPRGSAEHAWRTRAARKYIWLHIGRPVNTWPTGKDAQ